jgi:hypothetical protein
VVSSQRRQACELLVNPTPATSGSSASGSHPERQVPAPPEIIAGTLAYMAPEQTGRMNRSIAITSPVHYESIRLLAAAAFSPR